MSWKSVRAVLAGALVATVITLLFDIVLSATGAFPSGSEPINDAQALLASSYRVVIGIGGGWLTARLAPTKPMTHAMVLGSIGALVALAGVVATWNLGLGPRWYPISLVILAIPQCWIGAKLHELRETRALHHPR